MGQGVGSFLKAMATPEEHTLSNLLEDTVSSVLSKSVGELLMDKDSAGQTAAWNCAMGSVSCDIAYCNHAYCEKSDGTVGTMDECEGWDLFRGMPPLNA